jgi:drug/metabolite transporter (DMT)-like permease
MIGLHRTHLGLAIMLALGAIYVLWGSTFLAIRIAVETIPPLLMAGVRYASAGALMLAWLRLRGEPWPRPIHWRSAILIGALLLLGGNGAVSWSETRVPSGLASLVIATVPLWIVLIDWWRPGGVRPAKRVFAGVALGMIGLGALLGLGESFAGPRPDPIGAGVLVAGAVSWSFGSMLSRNAPLPRSPLVAIAIEMLCGGLLLVLFGLIVGEGAHFDPARVSARSVMAFLYLVGFGALIGFTAYVWLLRVVSPAKAATYAFVNPIVAVLLGWSLGGESLTRRMLIASVVIVAAVAIITTTPERPRPVRGESR